MPQKSADQSRHAQSVPHPLAASELARPWHNPKNCTLKASRQVGSAYTESAAVSHQPGVLGHTHKQDRYRHESSGHRRYGVSAKAPFADSAKWWHDSAAIRRMKGSLP